MPRAGSLRRALRDFVWTTVALLALAAPAGAAPKEFAAAVAAAERGDHAACRAEFERLAAAASQDGFARRALFGGALCAAQGGELDRAYALLEQAVARGFHDKNRFYFDPRLARVRADPRFPALERKFIERFAAWKSEQNAELVELVEQDRLDRRNGAGAPDTSYIVSRDRERGRRVREIVAAGGARTPDDKLNAALLLSRGDAVDDVELAQGLAAAAADADADLPGARRFAATTLDRLLVLSGKPQRYGTQTIFKDGKWSLAEVDAAVTDEERVAWDVPPLAECRARVEAMNAAPAEPPPSPREAPAPPG